MVDVGFNWYPNRFVKFYADWQLPYFATPVLVNPLTDRYASAPPLLGPLPDLLLTEILLKLE